MPAPRTPEPYVTFLEAKIATEVGPYEAKEALEAGEAILLDVRSDESWNQGHVPGALHIPRKQLAQRRSELPKGKTIIAYCSDITCQSSLKATIELRKNGIDAKHMTGGIERWVHKGYPTQVPTVQLAQPRTSKAPAR